MEELSLCNICTEEFDDDPSIRPSDGISSHLPIHSARCAHTSKTCYSCVIKIKMNKAVEENKDPCKIKWIACPDCRKMTCFNTEDLIVDIGRCDALRMIRAMRNDKPSVGGNGVVLKAGQSNDSTSSEVYVGSHKEARFSTVDGTKRARRIGKESTENISERQYLVTNGPVDDDTKMSEEDTMALVTTKEECEETDNEEISKGKDTDGSKHHPSIKEAAVINEQQYPLPIKEECDETKIEDKSTDDDSTDNETKTSGRQRKRPRLLANPGTTRTNAHESIAIQHTSKKRRHSGKRKRKEGERNGYVQKAARLECSVEGCSGKAADSGTCGAKHKGYNHCSHDGCTNKVVRGGVCIRHKEFAIEKDDRVCSFEGCNRKAADSGTCFVKHKGYSYCSHEGCTNIVVNRGVCVKHGAVVKTCKHEGCTNGVISKGVCIKHGAVKKRRKTCSYDGCKNQSKHGGLCTRHYKLSNGKSVAV